MTSMSADTVKEYDDWRIAQNFTSVNFFSGDRVKIFVMCSNFSIILNFGAFLWMLVLSTSLKMVGRQKVCQHASLVPLERA